MLTLGDKQFRCALGKNGVSTNKIEGDGATPAGTFQIREVFYRADRAPKPESVFRTTSLKPEDGWCDAPEDPNYNRRVTLPYPAHAENLWREDEIYDVIAVLGYNDNPPIPGKGSAIFMHVARVDYSPTEGCVALALADIFAVLREADRETKLDVGP